MDPVNWSTLLALFSISTFSSAAMLWAVKLLTSKLFEEIQGLKKSLEAGENRAQELEKELLRLEANLARDYVRRDDWLRVVGKIDAKLDQLWIAVNRKPGEDPTNG